MLQALTLILLIQAVGEAIHQLAGIPIPSAVIGMLILLMLLFINDRLIDMIRPTTGVMLTNLSLFFIPPAVGLINHGERFMREGVLIVVVLFLSAILGLLATGFTMRFVMRMISKNDTNP